MTDFVDPETQIARPANETQGMDVALVVISIT